MANSYNPDGSVAAKRDNAPGQGGAATKTRDPDPPQCYLTGVHGQEVLSATVCAACDPARDSKLTDSAPASGVRMMTNSLERICDALYFVPASDRDTWLRMGMAIKAELGDAGFDLWEEWSQQDGSFDPKAARDVWKSIRANGKVTTGTLFHEAKAHGWRDHGTYQEPTPEQIADRRRGAAERAAQEKAEIARERAVTAKKAAAIWKAATEAKADNPYLSRKRVAPVATLREIDASAAAAILGYVSKSSGDPLEGRLLVVPVKVGDRLSTLELIDGDGRKTALFGRGTKAGGYWAAQPLPDGDGEGFTFNYCEGGATTLSVKEAGGDINIAVLTCSNFKAVVAAMSRRYAKGTHVICADLGNGEKDAEEAARFVGCKLSIPSFTPEEVERFRAAHGKAPTDFNDLAQLCGADAVKRAIATAAAPDEGTPQPDKSVRGADHSGAEPEPLRATLPSAELYPVAALGDILGGAANALHDAVKAPLALCCQSVLAAASLAAQALFDIKLPWGERKPLSLFLLTVGASGERKSAVDDLVLGAAKAQERADVANYQAAQDLYEEDMAAWKQAADTVRMPATAGKQEQAMAANTQGEYPCSEKPTAPVAPLRFVTDPTVEGLYKLLAKGQPSVALFSDEGGLLIGGHALNSDNALKTMARWCKMWDGSPFDRVRAGDGAGILYGRRMALHQLAQPDVMTELLSDRMANGQGLLARCLVAWPESTIGTRHVDRYEWAGDRPQLKRLFAVLKSLLEAQPRIGETYQQELDPVELPLSDAAAALAVAAGNQFESLMAKGGDLAELRDRTSKALENAGRIAGVFAVVEGGLAVREIDVSHLQRALEVVQWYLAESLRIRGAATVPQAVLDAELLSAWLKEKRIRAFRTKQVLNAGPNPLRNKPRLLAAIKELVVCGYLAEDEPGTVIDGVRARVSWTVLHHVV